MSSVIVIDIETTSRHPSNAQIITACVIILDMQFNELERKTFKIRPRYWDKHAEESVAIHGITKEMARHFKPREEALPRLMKFIPEDQNWLGCHANRKAGVFGCFDRQVLSMNLFDFALDYKDCSHHELDMKLPASKVISSHTVAKKLLTLDNYKVSTICSHMGIPLKHHDAESDAEACAEILRRFSKQVNVFEICGDEYEIAGFNKIEKSYTKLFAGRVSETVERVKPVSKSDRERFKEIASVFDKKDRQDFAIEYPIID